MEFRRILRTFIVNHWLFLRKNYFSAQYNQIKSIFWRNHYSVNKFFDRGMAETQSFESWNSCNRSWLPVLCSKAWHPTVKNLCWLYPRSYCFICIHKPIKSRGASWTYQVQVIFKKSENQCIKPISMVWQQWLVQISQQ